MKKLIIFTSLLLSFSSQSMSLKFIGDQIYKTGDKFKETEVGGLSGLFYDHTRQVLLAISDDRSQKNSARFYEFDMTISDSKFLVTPKNVVILKNKDQKTFEKKTVDFEGLTLIGDTLYVSSEGDINRNPQINPELFSFDLQGNFKKSIDIPEKFLPNADKPDSRGVRNNLAFEVLASTPNSAHFFLGTEEALLQDGSITTPKFASKVRLIEFENNSAKREFAYELDKVQSESVAGLVAGETGLVDIALFDQTSFLSMERSYLPLAKKTIVKIFLCKITNNTTDIKNIESLKNQKINAIEKTLVLNLDDILPKLSKEHPILDNIEGIVIGPKLPNGNSTLVLVSDNNFSVFQKTVFYAFEIVP